ncbi:hypothetical protein ACFOEQ_13830 [Chryseobacterium arachidis]|uniref:hypothetical protein n=1 Tax=Chryseobacterium arachidis TaxID=1416778 RepID=UPI0036224862
MTGNATNPLVRIIIHKNGSVEMYGSKSSNGNSYPLELYQGNHFNTVNWSHTGSNTVVLKQHVVNTTYITGNGKGVKHGFCDPDGDGISNELDLDSDNDGCLDTMEGNENVATSMLVNAAMGLSVGAGSSAANQIFVLQHRV